jgi:hypothetical protein
MSQTAANRAGTVAAGTIRDLADGRGRYPLYAQSEDLPDKGVKNEDEAATGQRKLGRGV